LGAVQQGLPGYFSVKSSMKDIKDRREIRWKMQKNHQGRTEAGTKQIPLQD